MDPCVRRSKRISGDAVWMLYAFCGVRLIRQMSSHSWGYLISFSIVGRADQIIPWLFLKQWPLAARLLLRWLPNQMPGYLLKGVVSPSCLAMPLKSALPLFVYAATRRCAARWGEWPGNM